MSLVNGGSPRHDGHRVASLGKRKRAGSQDVLGSGNNTLDLDRAKVEEGVQDLLKLLRDYDPSPSILRHPLSTSSLNEPEVKRTRLSKLPGAPESIESRATSGFYTSIRQIVEDVDHAATEILDTSQGLSEQVNGESKSRIVVDAKAKDQITSIRTAVAKKWRQLEAQIEPGIAEDDLIKSRNADLELRNTDQCDRGQVLTLRTQTDRGPRQVYSGLQRHGDCGERTVEASGEKRYTAIDGKTLPNGFELADASLLEAHTHRKTVRESRGIGEVFQPSRKLKALELPRPSQSVARGSSLCFVNSSDILYDKATPTYKQDYKFTRLPTSEWLRYDDTASATRRRRGDRSSNAGDFRTGGFERIDADKTSALFLSSYSSFAPTTDSSSAVVPEKSRSQLWWSRAGASRSNKLFRPQYPEVEPDDTIPTTVASSSDDFTGLLEDFQLEQEQIEDNSMGQNAVPHDVDSLLSEVSDLLETLTSYQRNRNLQSPKASNPPPSPSAAEFDLYEVLRSQLVVLVESLPPFAVAKLDGDQLQALNISSSLLVENVDYPGSGEVDEITLQRRKAAAAAASAASRTANTTPASGRPNTYQTPSAAAAGAANYRARALNAAGPASSISSYGTTATPSQPYQTPRLPVAGQAPGPAQRSYQPNATPSYSQQPNVAQFQRPVQNGYSNYQASTPAQPAYLQRPSQPGYQQRAQETTAFYARSASPQKPLVNGQTYSQPQLHSPYPQHQQLPPQRPPSGIGTTANAMQHATEEQRATMVRLQQQQQVQQQAALRQGSGTPLPQTSGTTAGYARFDGADGRSQSREISASAATPTGAAEGAR